MATKAAVVAMALGMMTERLYTRRHEDDALHGIEVKTARAKGGEAAGGARRAAALDWIPRARALAADARRRNPRLGANSIATKIAPQLAAETGIKRSPGTIRLHIGSPKNS